MSKTVEPFGLLSGYTDIFTDAVYVVVAGLVGVYLLQRLTKRFIYRHLRSTRFFGAIFGTLYFLVLGVTTRIALDEMGYNVQNASELMILLVIVVATLSASAFSKQMNARRPMCLQAMEQCCPLLTTSLKSECLLPGSVPAKMRSVWQHLMLARRDNR